MKTKKSTTKVSIYDYGRSLKRALRLIEIFKAKNKLVFELEIKLDFSENDLGYFNYDPKEKVIYVNPTQCVECKKDYRIGSPWDNSVFYVVIHELSHFLDQKFKLISEYGQEKFALKRLLLTPMGRKDKYEELADILIIYLINPYFLRLVNKERFDWLKSKFKSPSRCGKMQFLDYYFKWSKKTQKKFKKKFKLNIDEERQEIERC